jgi:hypothetical protein
MRGGDDLLRVDALQVDAGRADARASSNAVTRNLIGGVPEAL